MLLRDKQIEEIRQLVDDLHLVLLVTLFGEGAVTPETARRLKLRGYTWPSKPVAIPKDAYQFGLIAAQLKRRGKKLPVSYEQFQKYIKSNPIPLTQEERDTIKHLQRSMETVFTGLGDKIKKDTGQIIATADAKLRRTLAGAAQRELISGVEHRRAVADVASRMRQATHDWAFDFLRAAATELNNAHQEGRLKDIQSRNKGRDPRVYKQPRPDACPECVKHYTVDGTKPRIYRLSQLIANGSNVGRKKAERRAVVDSLHPWCRCELHELPDGFELNDQGHQVYVGKEAG